MNSQNKNCIQRNSIKVLLALCMLYYASINGNAYTGQPFTTYIDSMETAFDLDSNWVYKKGDDLSWAAFDLNDRSWTPISTNLNMDSIDDSVFGGKGWFRLHININPDMYNQSYALLMKQQGASEIFLNGEKIKTLGVFENDTSIEEHINPRLLPILIQFSDSSHQVIAVRYAHNKAQDYNKKFYHTTAGFSLSINNHNYTVEQLNYMVVSNYVFLGMIMIFGILGLIHLLLYLFYRKRISNLYYSIFMLMFSFMIFGGMQQNAISFNPDWLTKILYTISLIAPALFIALQGFVYSIIYPKTHKFLKISLVIGLLVSISFFFRFSFSAYFLAGFSVLISIDIIRLLILILTKKIEGGWIIGLGMLLFVLFFVFVLFIGIFISDGLHIDSGDPYAYLILTLIGLTILSPPISMSIYLARDFALTNINLSKQLEQVKMLSAKTLEQEREKKKILEGQKEKLELQVKERTKELEAEKEKTEELLLNTLPLKVVNDLKENGKTKPESFEEVTVYFSDIVGFTKLSTQLAPDVLIDELNQIFTSFDDIMTKNQCERIKTIGDAYLAVCGMPDKNPDHASNMLQSAIEIKKYLEERNKKSDIEWKIRIGIHSGKVVGGIVGVRKYIYDVFGDTINTTSRMESNSEPMQINVSETTYHLTKDKFKFIARKPMEIKGKGIMKMYFLKN